MPCYAIHGAEQRQNRQCGHEARVGRGMQRGAAHGSFVLGKTMYAYGHLLDISCKERCIDIQCSLLKRQTGANRGAGKPHRAERPRRGAAACTGSRAARGRAGRTCCVRSRRARSAAPRGVGGACPCARGCALTTRSSTTGDLRMLTVSTIRRPAEEHRFHPSSLAVLAHCVRPVVAHAGMQVGWPA